MDYFHIYIYISLARSLPLFLALSLAIYISCKRKFHIPSEYHILEGKLSVSLSPYFYLSQNKFKQILILKSWATFIYISRSLSPSLSCSLSLAIYINCKQIFHIRSEYHILEGKLSVSPSLRINVKKIIFSLSPSLFCSLSSYLY